MALITLIADVGGLRIDTNTTYTSANVPEGVDVVTLDMGVRITDENGALTPIRGVRMMVSKIGTTYPNPNIPVIWIEGTTKAFTPSTNYTFLDEGRVSFGVKVSI